MELLKVTEEMLVALNHAESAIKAAIADEDGLDGAIGEMALKEISRAVASYHLWIRKCNQCGHKWRPLVKRSLKCPNPKCQSADWDKPKKKSPYPKVAA